LARRNGDARVQAGLDERDAMPGDQSRRQSLRAARHDALWPLVLRRARRQMPVEQRIRMVIVVTSVVPRTLRAYRWRSNSPNWWVSG